MSRGPHKARRTAAIRRARERLEAAVSEYLLHLQLGAPLAHGAWRWGNARASWSKAMPYKLVHCWQRSEFVSGHQQFTRWSPVCGSQSEIGALREDWLVGPLNPLELQADQHLCQKCRAIVSTKGMRVEYP